MGLINVAIAGLVEDFIWFIQKEYKMKKTLKSGKKNVKKIWVSRDEKPDIYDDYKVFRAKPETILGRYITSCKRRFIGKGSIETMSKLFGDIKPGQCKCFEIREVKE